jgi:type I restriction enzyme R subunit
MTPEQTARQEIDRQLVQTGWMVQDYAQMNISAEFGIAIREFPLKTGFADYMLYVDGKAIGVVEAKPAGHFLVGVEGQSLKYLNGLPPNVPHYRLPLPFSYESNGIETRFTNHLEVDPRSRTLFTFHRPEELLRLAGLEKQVRTLLREMPPLMAQNLWKVQIEAITNLEKSLAMNKPRALIQMATGSGKTFTAVNFCYRLIKYAKVKRILFLVDRNNLGTQTLNEFQQFVSPVNGYKFTDEYSVQHLKKNSIAPAAKVCITTIQRLYSMLKGEDEFDETNEEASSFENEPADQAEPVHVEYNPKLPIESFDVIVVDECHRSIYGLWKAVFGYFDSFVIGLTATPSKNAFGFFNQNLVQEYTHEKAVIDGVNVGFDVFTIETEITKDGATLKKAESYVPVRDRRTKKKDQIKLDDDVTYSGKQLNMDVVNKSQILREEFGRGNDFCQKITSKSHKPNEMLKQLRNSYNPRIAVTVDMIATGTDVKPLECLLFLRDVRSKNYFEQMKGRGCRIVDSDALQGVTPDAKIKTHFVIVDAVGACTSEKKAFTTPLDRKPSVPLKKLMASVGQGIQDPDTVSALAAKLSRLQLSEDEKETIKSHTGGRTLEELSTNLLSAVDTDQLDLAVREQFQILDNLEPTDEQLDQTERACCREALKPFHNADLRQAIVEIQERQTQIIDEQNFDELRSAGFDNAAKQKAESLVTSFAEFIKEHKDEIEALQVLYNVPYRAGLKFRHVKDLASKLNQSPFFVDPTRPESLSRLWQAYEMLEPQNVRGKGGKQLVDVIALVRHAIDPNTPLAPVGMTVEERYQHWLAEKQTAGVTFTADQQKWLDAIKDHIASSLNIEQDDLEEVPFNGIGGLGKAYELFGDKLNEILDELNVRLAS